MPTGMKFDVVGEYDGKPFRMGMNLSRVLAEDMVKRKGGKIVPAGSKID